MMKPLPKLTRKQKAFADELLANPKQSATQAANKTYDVATLNAAAVQAHQNLMKPNVQLYLDEHVQKAKNKVVTLIDSDDEQIALRASDSILDRTLGKATQRVEQHTTGVTLMIDLSSSLALPNSK